MSKVQPPKGFRDFMPDRFIRREALKRLIAETYESFGYRPIDTPVLENLEVLLGKGGGENEKLMFMVLKRGEKLRNALVSGKPTDLADAGLRFDLTVPLARFTATNLGRLPRVFKRYHIGPVWRADRPQRGRFREFTQCDVDIIGSSEPAADADVILATADCMNKLGFDNLTVHLNSRPLLKQLVLSLGTPEERLEEVCRVLDKLDRIGLEGVAGELGDLPGSEELVRFGESFGPPDNEQRLLAVYERIGPEGREEVEGLRRIIDLCSTLRGARLLFDPYLVRGMDYYTGPVYEIRHPEVSFSLAGGGRYDKLVGMFCGKEIPATGFSIGFERILTLIEKREEKQDEAATAAFVDVAIWAESPEREGEAFILADRLRNRGLKADVLFGKRARGKLFKEMETGGARIGVVLPASTGLFQVRDLAARGALCESPDMEEVLERIEERWRSALE